MSSLLTQHYRTTLATAFLNKLQVWEAMETALLTDPAAISSNALATIRSAGVGPEVMYLCIGYPYAWADTSNGTVNDVNPPIPVESVQKLSFDVWRNMMGAKRVYTANVNFVVPRVDWTANTVYDQYDDIADDLHTKTLHVLDTSDVPYRVYKCLWNNGGSVSTESPNLAVEDSLEAEVTLDGYVWKYMYSLPSTRDKFLTANWMPVYTDANVVTHASNYEGTLPTAVPLVIVDGGEGYGTNVPAVKLYGDGINAEVAANGTTLVGGSVQSIILSAGGNNYTEVHTVNTYYVGATPAVARVIVPPYRNHGYDAVYEMFAKHLMVYMELDGTEGNHLTVDNDYRQISLIVNPIEAAALSNANVCPLGSHVFYKQTYDLMLSANTGVFSPDDVIYTVGQTDINGRAVAPTATVVDVIVVDANGDIATSGNTIVRVARIYPEGLSDPFPIGETIKCDESTVEGTIANVATPELVPYRGEIIYLNQRAPVSRVSGQSEEIKIVLPFGG